MSSTTYTTRQTAVNIFVASYPVLKSESLSAKETTNGGGSKTYSCGQIAFLGQPPINIIMKGSDGTVLPSTYRDGYQLVTLPYSKDGQQVTCEVDKNSTAYHCIPEADLSRWGLPTIKEPHTANSNFLIYFIAVGFVGLLLIVILVVVGGKKYFLRQRESDLEGHDHDNHDDLVLPEVKDKDFSEVDMSLDKRTTNNINSSLSYPASSLSYQPKQQEDYKKYEVNGKGRLS